MSPPQRSEIERAAALEGESVSAFVVQAALHRAAKAIDEHATTVVPNEYFDRLLATLDEPDPAPRLANAVRKARRSARITAT